MAGPTRGQEKHEGRARIKPGRALITACLLALASFLLAPHPAHGWGNTWMGTLLEQVVSAARWRAGAFRVNAALDLGNAGYDSDIYYGSVLNPIPDYTFTAGPAVQFLLPLKKKVVFDFIDSPQYIFYLHTKRERAWNNIFRGQVHFAFDRFYIKAGGGLTNARQRLSTELPVNVRLNEKDLGGLILWQVSKGASLALQYGTFTYNYGTETFGGINIGESLNRTENYINFTAYLHQHLRTRLYLNGEYGSFAFKEQASRFRNSRSYGIYGGVEFVPAAEGQALTSGVHGRINIGYKRFGLLANRNNHFAGLVGNTDISLGIFRLTALHGYFLRNVQFSAFSDVAYYLETLYGVGLSRYIDRRVILTYNVYFSRNRYPQGESSGGVPLEGIIDRYTTHTLNLNIALRRDLAFGLIASLGKRAMNPFAPAGNRCFLGINLIYGYPPGITPVLANPITQ
jgi:hypothetical protein